MLTIRSEQMDALAEGRRAAFVHRLRAWLQQRLDQRGVTVDAAELDAQIGKGLAQAHRFQLRHEDEVARFVDLVLARWGQFPEGDFPRPVLAVLTAHGLDAAVKLARFEALIHAGAAGHA